MNELIRELAVKAGDDWYHTLHEDREFLVKFAELIVRECASACESATKEGDPLHLVSLGYSQRVKQHFGIK